MGMIKHLARYLLGVDYELLELRARIKSLHRIIDQANEAHRSRHTQLMRARSEAADAEGERDSVKCQYNDLVTKHNAVCLKLQKMDEAIQEAATSAVRNGYTANGSRVFVDTPVMDHLVDSAGIDPEAAMAAHNDVLIRELANLAMTALPTNTTRADVSVWLNARAGDHREAYNRAMKE